ncbi:MAG: hypothetical protein IT215_03835 [Chitinophagaceae bacterium]|nr:hypothetical protein [Chitinophagaceae bacterium]
MKSILFSTMLLFTLSTFAQKDEKGKVEYDKKTGQVSLNGDVVFSIEKEKGNTFAGSSIYNFKTTDGKIFIIFSQNQIPSADGYYDIIFPDNTDLKADCALWGVSKLAQVVYDNQLLKNRIPDPAAIKVFAAKMGTNFNDRRFGRR